MSKGKKALVKGVAALLTLSALGAGVGCGSENFLADYGDTTVIYVGNFGGGIGRKWLDEAAERFKALVADTEYEPGKKGVVFDITHAIGVDCVGMKTEGFSIYFCQDKYNEYVAEITPGNVLDITDIVKNKTLEKFGENVTIESKIAEEYRFALKGNDGKYYMLPHYETHSGASYDVDLFERKGLFLAQECGCSTEYDCALTGETYYFTNEDCDHKTVGNDGKEGTDDDGMPTTLNELVAMCDHMYEEESVVPFSVAGGHIDYTNYFIDGLWTALAGYEQRSAVSALKGEVEYVKKLTEQELWADTGILVPETEKVTNLTAETGYKAINQAARYYAFAFLELAYQKGWIYEGYKESSYTHKEAMKAFILNGLNGNDVIGSHIEGSYWYNEAESYNLFNDYKIQSGTGSSIKNIKHWHMPTSYGNEVVTGESNAREEAMINSFTSMALINGNLDDEPGNEGLIQACKDFLQFLCTEQELKNFTGCTGVSKSLYDYEIDDSVIENLDPYQQSIMRLRANNRVVNQYGDNATYRAKALYLTYSCSAPGFHPYFDGVEYTTPLDAFWKKNKTAWDCFEVTGFSASKWKNEVYKAED